MIHALADNARYFGQLSTELMPDVELVHFVDAGLPAMASEALRPRVIERLQTLAAFAMESGAEAILLTCTAFGRLVDDVKGAVTCPVVSVLEIMVAEAMELQGTIGVLGSHPGTLATAERMLHEQASLDARRIEVVTQLCPGAFDAMQRDDWAAHNRIVLEHLRTLENSVDVIVAPQPSIERAIQECRQADMKIPVVTSPRLSILRLEETLNSTT